MIGAVDCRHLIAIFQRHGADEAGARTMLEVSEIELRRYLAAVEDRALDPPLADKLKRIRKIQRQADDLATEITKTLVDEHQLREIAVRLTDTTPEPLVGALHDAQGALLILSARLRAAGQIAPKRGARLGVPLDPFVDAFAAVWRRYIGEPTATREGPFEESVRAVLAAAGVADDDTFLYDIVCAAVKRRKKAATPR